MPSLLFLVEYKNSHIVDKTEAMVNPFLFSTVAGMINLTILEEKLSFTPVTLISLYDSSFVLLGHITFNPSEEIAINFVAPFFLGDEESEFGQFAKNHLISLEVVVRF